MTNLKVFENERFGAVRVIEMGSEPWFVGKDVADVLEYTNARKAFADHVAEDDKKIIKSNESLPLDIPNRGMTVINESGLYSLIFSSKLPKAKEFKRWVTSEVLPAIRKHGAYMTSETLEKAILNPDMIIKLCMDLKESEERSKAMEIANSQLTVKTTIMQPKADYFDELVDRNLLTNFRETAKQLEVGEKKFIGFLIEKKYVYRDKRGKLMPYADKNDGLFEMKETYNEKTKWSGTQTLITPKGRETFRLLVKNL